VIYHYSVFGYYIQSEVSLDAFRAVEPGEKPDVLVKEGVVSPPEEGLEHTVYKRHLIYNPTLCYRRLPEDAGAFIIRKKEGLTEVTLDFRTPSKSQTLLAYFYGTGLSAILQLNDQFALHASGVLVEKKLVLFCGKSGIGKSTLAAHLKSRGYPIFSDDKCVLFKSSDDQKWYAFPSLQIMRLWDDAATEIPTEQFLTDPIPILTRKNKQQYRIKEADLVDSKVPLAGIFLLSNTDAKSNLSCQNLQGIKKLRLLQAQVFRRHMITAFQKERVLWDFISSLAADIPVFQIMRPQDTPAVSFGKYIQEVIIKQV